MRYIHLQNGKRVMWTQCRVEVKERKCRAKVVMQHRRGVKDAETTQTGAAKVQKRKRGHLHADPPPWPGRASQPYFPSVQLCKDVVDRQEREIKRLRENNARSR